jgi:hypothetical protein
LRTSVDILGIFGAFLKKILNFGRCWYLIFQNMFAKKLEKIGNLPRLKILLFYAKIDHSFGFQENLNFCRKLVSIAEYSNR